MKRHIQTVLPFFLFLFITISGQGQDGATKITGKVLDASNKAPIEGAYLYTNDSLSTITNSEGMFVLEKKDPNGQLFITAEGYARQIMPLKGRTELTISLYEEGYKSPQSDINLDYITKPHIYTTQSVEQADFEEESYMHPGTSADELFKSSFSGLSVTTRSGMLGNGSILNIRGINSLNCSNRPLIIIDGIINDFESSGKELVSGAAFNSLAGINIDDIESVTVLKDGTSIYGAQGGNGVIFIETIRAKETATKIQFSTYRGVRYGAGKIPVMNSYDYRTYLSELLYSQGFSADSVSTLPYMIDDTDYTEYYTYHNETDWQDSVYVDGIVENYNFKIKGGDNIALYGLSLGYMGNEGIVKNTSFERYSIRFNTDIKISQQVTVQANISWSSGIRNLMDDGISPVTNPLHLSLVKAPFLYPNQISPTGDISPRYEDADILGVSNPVALLEYMTAIQRSNATSANLRLNYNATEKLKISNLLGINYYKTRFNTFVPHTGVADYVSDLGVIENTMQNKVESKYMIYNDTRASYELLNRNDQSIFAVAGIRLMMNQTEEDWGIAHNSPNDEMRSIGQGVNQFNEIGGYIGDWNTLTYYTQVDYDYQKKYFATAGLSLDGSSRFGDEANGIPLFVNRFAVFPSITTAWLVSSEDFMHNLEAISFAKLRLGYTMAGNGDIGNYASYKYYIPQNLLGAYGLVSGNLFNPGLQWENNNKATVGLDLGLFNDRITATADLFVNTTKNLLTLIQPEYYVGYDSYLTNFGSLKTSGIDATINARIVNRRVKWDASINLQKYTTIVTEYFGDEEIVDVYGGQVLIREGEPLGQFYGYQTLGVFATDEAAASANLSAEMPNSDLIPFQAGDIIFDDVNDDHIINELDRQVLGDPNPKLAGNMFSAIHVGGLTISATVGFSYGNNVYNYLRRNLESMTTYDNQTEAILNRWRVQGQETNIPKAVYGDPMGNARFSNRWIEDGSYIRLRDVTLNYRLPLSKLITQTVDVFITGQNLVTLTNYLGLDPEFAMGTSPFVRGIDVGMTPQTKAVFAGLRIGL